ncbi:MAG: glycosyltransferase family 4 protein [Chloroflexi bacterium]|nr:glycosyltransferase family 4 protein [Chloroflexota bacterium]
MTQTLKVAMLIQGYLPRIGGAERQLAALAPLLRERGVEIHVITRRYPGLSAFEMIDGVPVHRLPIPGPKAVASLSYTVTAVPLLMRLRPHLIHAHELLSPTTTAVLGKRILGIPAVAKLLRGGVLGDLAKLKKKPGGLRRLNTFRKQVDAFIAISREIDNELADVDIPSSHRVFIPNGVDTNRFQPATAAEKISLRQKLNLPQGPLTIFTGRLSPEKRINDVISAWPAVRQAHPDAALVIVGSGDEATRLQSMAGDGVAFMGRIEDVAPYLRCADIFILPSETEGLSNALLEAMACELAAVATTVGGATDLIAHQQSGWLIPAHEPDAIPDVLTALLDDALLRRQLGRQARKKIMADYTLSKTADRLRHLYDAVLHQRAPNLTASSLEVAANSANIDRKLSIGRNNEL